MTPIEAALARVRELREAERKILDGIFDHEPDCRAPDNRECTCSVVPSAALRNAAPSLLDLLEALLEEQKAEDVIAECQNTRSILTRPIQMLDDSRDKVRAALAAFVEGEDGK